MYSFSCVPRPLSLFVTMYHLCIALPCAVCAIAPSLVSGLRSFFSVSLCKSTLSLLQVVRACFEHRVRVLGFWLCLPCFAPCSNCTIFACFLCAVCMWLPLVLSPAGGSFFLSLSVHLYFSCRRVPACVLQPPLRAPVGGVARAPQGPGAVVASFPGARCRPGAMASLRPPSSRGRSGSSALPYVGATHPSVGQARLSLREPLATPDARSCPAFD
jgi:hypothetical protein